MVPILCPGEDNGRSEVNASISLAGYVLSDSVPIVRVVDCDGDKSTRHLDS